MAEGIGFIKKLENISEYEVWDMAVYDLRLAFERIERMEKVKAPEEFTKAAIMEFLSSYERLSKTKPPDMVMKKQYDKMMETINTFKTMYEKDPREAMRVWYSAMLRATDDFLVAYYG